MKLKLTTTLFFATILFFSTVDYANAATIQSMSPNFSNAVLPAGVQIPVSGIIDFYKRDPVYAGGSMSIAYKLDGVYMPYIWYTDAPYSCCGQSYSGSVGPFTEGPHTIQFVVYIAYPGFSQEFYTIQNFTAAPITAKITIPVSNPTTYGTGSSILLSGGAEGGSSSDGLSTYEWREGSCSTGTLLASSQSFQKNNFSVGQHTIYLRVKDSSNTWSTNCPSRTVNISANGVPTAVITDPVDTSLVIAPGGSVFFSGYGIDPDGDTITQYTWRRYSASGGWPTIVNTGTSFSLNFPSAGSYYVYLSVKDSNNNWSTNQPTRHVSVTSSPSATISASPNTCTIASGASTCNIPFTWNIINAVTPNIYNTTRAIQYSTSASGNNLSYAITNGSNTVQARSSTNVLNWVVVTGNCVGGTSWNGSSCVSNNTSSPPTISGPTTRITGQNGTYSFVATDPEGDSVRYGIDWDMDNLVDNWLPASGYVSSGTSRSMNYTWTTTGNKQFKALTQDILNNNSTWATYSVAVSDPQICTETAVDSVGSWSLCASSATCSTPPSPAQLTNQSGIQSGTCPPPEYTNNTVYRTCNTATITCTPSTFCGDNICNGLETMTTCPADCKPKTRFWQF